MNDIRSYHVDWYVGCEVCRDVTIHIQEGKVVGIDSGCATHAIHLEPAVLVDGLVNAHTHLEFSSFASPISTTGRFTDWIRAVVAHRRTEAASVHDSIRSGIRESLAEGTTLIGEIATTGWSWSDYVESGFQGVVFQEILSLLPERIAQQKDLVSAHVQPHEVQTTTFSASHHSEIIRGISPHAPYSTHLELVQHAVNISRTTGSPLAMHLAETTAELELLKFQQGEFRELLTGWGLWQDVPGRFGARPLDYLDLLAQAPRTLVIHGNYLNDEELRFLAKQPQMSLIYCPRTHAAFGHSAHPWLKAMEFGVRVALGTDSRASNPDLSVFKELQFLAARHSEISHLDLLKLGSVEARIALGFPDQTWADFTLLRMTKPLVDPQLELFLPENRVCGTMIHGEWRWLEPSLSQVSCLPVN